MGRYYNGDIEGKFMFAVQSSNAADRFGSEGYSNYLEYYFSEDHIPTIIATFGENLAWMQTNDDIYDVNLYFDKDKPPVECLVIQGRLLKDTVRWASQRGGMICYANDVELFKDILNNFKWKEHNYLTLNAIIKRHNKSKNILY